MAEKKVEIAHHQPKQPKKSEEEQELENEQEIIEREMALANAIEQETKLVIKQNQANNLAQI